MSVLKAIIAGLVVFTCMAVMYHMGETDGYKRGHDRGYDLGYEYGYWRRGKLGGGGGE